MYKKEKKEKRVNKCKKCKKVQNGRWNKLKHVKCKIIKHIER